MSLNVFRAGDEARRRSLKKVLGNHKITIGDALIAGLWDD